MQLYNFFFQMPRFNEKRWYLNLLLFTKSQRFVSFKLELYSLYQITI